MLFPFLDNYVKMLPEKHLFLEDHMTYYVILCNNASGELSFLEQSHGPLCHPIIFPFLENHMISLHKLIASASLDS